MKQPYFWWFKIQNFCELKVNLVLNLAAIADAEAVVYICSYPQFPVCFKVSLRMTENIKQSGLLFTDT